MNAFSCSLLLLLQAGLTRWPSGYGRLSTSNLKRQMGAGAGTGRYGTAHALWTRRFTCTPTPRCMPPAQSLWRTPSLCGQPNGPTWQVSVAAGGCGLWWWVVVGCQGAGAGPLVEAAFADWVKKLYIGDAFAANACREVMLCTKRCRMPSGPA